MFSADLGVTPTSATYIEDVFSTYLYDGGNHPYSIPNGIDLSTKGGMVWFKSRSGAANHNLYDTARGATKYLISNNTSAQNTSSQGLTAFNSDGFTIGSDATINTSGTTYASWTFRKQAKFFDVVTFTTPASGSIVVPHNLGSTPGCVITKATGISQFWVVNHRSLTSTEYLVLNDTAAKASAGALTYTADANNVTFSAGYLSASTAYVMYLFAHDAGGFGAAGTDNVISCGSFTTNGSGNATVTLGYEPQWIITKRTDSTSNWTMQDIMRGLGVLNSTSTELRANTSSQEFGSTGIAGNIFATGFNQTGLSASATYIYIAIRRGPMKTPTSGTSVFSPKAQTATAGTSVDVGFPVDASICTYRTAYNANYMGATQDRLRGYATTDTSGAYPMFMTWATDSETAFGPGNPVIYGINNAQTTISFGANAATGSTIVWNFRRAPGFFDVVCYTGNGSAQTLNHNLGVVPELIINKNRSGTDDWYTTTAALTNPDTYVLTLNTTNAQGNTGVNFIYNRTATTFSIFSGLSNSAQNYVNYLFATVAGVSKVGSYTGTGATKQIDCGFTGGARFVLIKRTDSTGGWYVWDSARGIVAGNDPYLLLNSNVAEVTTTDYVDTYSAGFEISSTAPAAINANGGSFIFLAIS